MRPRQTYYFFVPAEVTNVPAAAFEVAKTEDEFNQMTEHFDLQRVAAPKADAINYIELEQVGLNYGAPTQCIQTVEGCHFYGWSTC